MPAPANHEYSVEALEAAHTSFRDLIDAGTGTGSIKIYSEADVLLGEIPLTEPCGTVSAVTGQLTLTASASEESAPAGGACTYGTICDGDGVAHLAIPAQQGATPVVGKIVLNTTTIVAGSIVSLVSAVIG